MVRWKDDYKYILHIEHKFENLSSIIANLISTVESKNQKKKKKNRTINNKLCRV